MEKKIRAARILEYGKPLSLDSVPKPRINLDEEVLVKVGAAGLCHSDLHLLNGEWKSIIPLDLPKTPGHEIAGWVEEVGKSVPNNLMAPGDLVGIFGGWGCGICLYCKQGDEQMCESAKWPGLSCYDGGFAEYILVPSYRFLVKVQDANISPEKLAPLTDAGLTPYRAIKKVRHLLGPGKSIGVIGIGGLGSYGVQYAKLFGAGSKVVALDRNDEKLELAQRCGADHVVNLSSNENVKDKIMEFTSNKGIDVILDTVGADSTITAAIKMIGKGGTIVLVGLMGNLGKIPVAPFVINEFKILGSLWGNYNELKDVIDLQVQGKIINNIRNFTLDEINEAVEMLKNGTIVGRGVIIP